MSSGSQARWLAPLALLAALLAVALIVTSSTGEDTDDPPAAQQTEQTGTSTGEERAQDDGAEQEEDTTGTTATTPATERETYTVQTGDTFGSIAEETGVSVAELQELNPTVDPQSLTVGQEIRLSR
jgi:LysM repeat protein